MSGRSGGSSSPTIEATYIVKLEFVQCALTVSRPLPNSYTPSALARVVVEAGSSVGDAFSLEKWITFGQTYLGLDARMCRVLFDRYLAIRDNRNEVLDSTRAQLSFEEMGTQAANNYEMQRSVHTPTFMMFLYLQLFHRTANIPANNTDSWLGGAVRHVALSQRTQDSDTFLTFLRRHMYDLLLCASLGQYKMTAEHVRHLTYLFHEYPPSPKDFGSEIPLWKQNSAQTLEISALHPYMQQHISSSAAWYPPLELPVAKSRPRVVWPDPGSTPNTRVAVLARIRGVFAKTIPPPNYVSQVCISSSSACSMYLLCSMPHVSLVGCSSCTIVLGSVGGVLTIEECENITVIATCSACHISNCTGVTLHACSNLQPVICGECTDIQLAPYNTYYNMLEMDMRIAGVNPQINKVLNFHNFSTNQAKSNIFAMAPREFTSTVIPLSAPPRSNTAPLTVANPCLMQKDYSDVIHQRAEVFSRTLQSVQKALSALHAEGTERSLQAATQLRTKIEARFASWVAQSGQQKVVLDMMQT